MSIKLAVLISGGGRTLQNLIDHINKGKLDAEIEVVVSSRSDAFGLMRAIKSGIDGVCVPFLKYKSNGNIEEFSKAINRHIDRFEIDLIVMAGFMHLFKAAPKWDGRIMNIHPALIPSFCGSGYYGKKVHEAVLEYGVRVSGCTVHFADNKYDNGPIILQSAVPVLEGDSADKLAARVFAEECKLYPRAIQLFAEDRLEITGRRVKIKAGSTGKCK